MNLSTNNIKSQYLNKKKTLIYNNGVVGLGKPIHKYF